jgi:glutamate N-acetyltransferase / amino-acid N-acetyltransferase
VSAQTKGGFFRSRWVERPDGVTELSPDDLPSGFRAAGVACGIKASGDRDLGVLVCDSEDATSAARFTRNALVAAPVVISRRADLSRLRGVVANSGNANVSDGEQGLAAAEAMATAAAEGLSLAPSSVGVASTGVIGRGLDRDRVLEGIGTALGELSPSAHDFAHAILTTDRGPKYATLELELSEGTARLSAQAKGAGMISPAFATMLCFVETDARIDAPTAARMLEAATERSFERISVDGQLSTNDSIFFIAGGSSGMAVEPGGEDEQRFAAALGAMLKQLALEIVADGEGATRVARLEVRGGIGAAEPVARSVANSPLVKCALFGGDPNWGRVLAAAGQVLPDAGAVGFDLAIEDLEVARESVRVALTETEQKSLNEVMRQPEVEMRLFFAGREEASEIYFSDLSHDYVQLNAAYST